MFLSVAFCQLGEVLGGKYDGGVVWITAEADGRESPSQSRAIIPLFFFLLQLPPFSSAVVKRVFYQCESTKARGVAHAIQLSTLVMTAIFTLYECHWVVPSCIMS